MIDLTELAAVANRIDEITQRLSSLGDAGGVPPVAGAFARTLKTAQEQAAGLPAGQASSRAGQPSSVDRALRDAALHHGLPEALVDAVAHVESAGNPRAVSPVGAAGLMQLMPGTARALGVSDALDPAQNAEGGARYLKSLLDRYHDLPQALAAYNAGPGAVDSHGGVPPYAETRAYVRKVLDLYHDHAGGTEATR